MSLVRVGGVADRARAWAAFIVVDARAGSAARAGSERLSMSGFPLFPRAGLHHRRRASTRSTSS